MKKLVFLIMAAFACVNSIAGIGTVMADSNGRITSNNALETRLSVITQDMENVARYTNKAYTAVQPENTNGWETGSHALFLTSAPPSPVVSVNGYTGAVTVTAASLGALTAEADPVAGPRLALLEGKADNWDAAYGWGNHALAGYMGAAMWQSWLGTNTYVKAETDQAALAALAAYDSTNRVTRWYESPTNWMEFAGGDKVFNYQVTANHFWHLEFTTDPLPLPYPLVAGTYGEWRVLDYDYGTYYVEWTRDGYGSAASGVHGLETEFSIPLSDGITNVFYSPVVVTNVFVRYLGSAPPLYAETWSYSDMTNWLAAGNAGESWVLDISSYSANAAVNNHLAATDPHPGKYAPASATNAPAWLVYSNVADSVTVVNQAERPVRIYGQGSNTGLVSFASLREPLPVFFEASAFASLSFSNAYVVGGGYWQANRVNMFIAFQSGTNTFITPITTREP